jgi:hypothetical protein
VQTKKREEERVEKQVKMAVGIMIIMITANVRLSLHRPGQALRASGG